METYRKLELKDKKEINFISGHLSWLLEKDIPLNIRYVTFLREPLSQFISSYNYIMQTPHNPHHEEVNKLAGIDDFLDWQINKEHDSYQTRFLGNALKYHRRELGYIADMQDKKQGQKVFDDGIKQLNKIEFVYVTEKFDEALIVMKKQLGWRKNPYYKRLNTSKHKEEPNNQLAKKIKEVHKYDFLIYEEAKRRHEEAVKEIGSGFNFSLKLFNVVNKRKGVLWANKL